MLELIDYVVLLCTLQWTECCLSGLISMAITIHKPPPGGGSQRGATQRKHRYFLTQVSLPLTRSKYSACRCFLMGPAWRVPSQIVNKSSWLKCSLHKCLWAPLLMHQGAWQILQTFFKRCGKQCLLILVNPLEMLTMQNGIGFLCVYNCRGVFFSLCAFFQAKLSVINDYQSNHTCKIN